MFRLNANFELFTPRQSSCNLCNYSIFERRKVQSVLQGTESMLFLGPKIWGLIPVEIKALKPLNDFKSKVRKLVPQQCSCRV